MRHIQLFLFSFFFFSFIGLQAQTKIEYLDINNVKAGYLLHGNMFWNPDSSKAAYEFPKGSGVHSNFASGLWIGGIDQSTNGLKVACQTYGTSGNDFWPGPLNEFNAASIDSATSANWSQIWKMNKSTIDSFLNITNHTLANTPFSILRWPGRKNPHARTPMNDTLQIPDRRMAPFIDVNNDNVYNPLDGDYPSILGDQMLFWVFNDKFGVKQSGSVGIGLEIHALAYAYNCPDLNNVTFLNYRVHNWTTSIIDSTYLGIWSDVDLGYAFDDYIGFDTVAQMGVVYNGDSFDEDVTNPNYPSKGYDSLLTQHAILLARGPKVDNPNYPATDPNPYIELGPSSFTYFGNGNSPLGDPTIPEQYYNYLTGSWRDGQPFRLGCDPSDTTKVPYPFVFPDEPSIVGGLSEKECNRSPFDRRMVFASGPFRLIPGIVPNDITFAFLNTDRGSDNSNFDAIRIVADSARNYHCGNWPQSVRNINKIEFTVYPNPASTSLTVSSENEILRLELFDLIGRKVKSAVNKQVDISKIPNGIYMIKVVTKQGAGAQKVQILN